jgi:hypothetical protein
MLDCADSANPNLYGNHLEKENLLSQSNHIEANNYQGANHKVGSQSNHIEANNYQGANHKVGNSYS